MTKQLPTHRHNFCPRCGVTRFEVIKIDGTIREPFAIQYGTTNKIFDGCQCQVCGEEWAFFGIMGRLEVVNTPITPDHDWMTIFGSIVAGLDGSIPENTQSLFDKTDILWAKLQVRKHNVMLHTEVLNFRKNPVPDIPPPPPLATLGGNTNFTNPLNNKEPNGNR